MTALLIGIAAAVGLALGFMVGCFVGHAHAWALQDEESEEEVLGIGAIVTLARDFADRETA